MLEGSFQRCPKIATRYSVAVTGGNMLLWMSLAARLAPLLLMTSLLLVAMRWLHDRVERRNRNAAMLASSVVLIAGLVVIIPYAARMGLIVGIRSAAEHGAWGVVSQRIDLYSRWGGRLEGNLYYARGAARSKEGRVAEALPDFVAAARSGDPLVSRSSAVFQAALCLYALHRDDEAMNVLLSLPDVSHDAAPRAYLLGRIAENRGDASAEQWFRRSLAADPSFQPALYRLLRILSMRHDISGALALVDAYRRANPEEANAPYLAAMVAAIRRGEVLVDYEPFRLTT